MSATATVRRGNLFVLSAPSGSGKTTLVTSLLGSLDGLRFSVSLTTRPRRGNERDGIDYHFVTEEAFREKIEAGEFLEWAEVYGNLYGTSRIETDRICEGGEDVVLDVDVQGAAQVRAASPSAVTIFVLPPSFSVLEERLRGRREDPPEVIEGRLNEARREVKRYDEYHYVIINDSVEKSANLLRAIVMAERARPRLLEERLRPVLSSFETGGES